MYRARHMISCVVQFIGCKVLSGKGFCIIVWLPMSTEISQDLRKKSCLCLQEVESR